MALIPILNVDLYPLANNHIWRTAFAFTNWATPAPSYMKLPDRTSAGGEDAWVSYTLQNYYALLNCGFRLRPTAGTANGVHPVPLGFGRVYVQLSGGFNYESWLSGLNAGRSFVTTGPMLLAKFTGRDPGERFSHKGDEPFPVRVSGTVLSQGPLRTIELIVNGEVTRTVAPTNTETPEGAMQTGFSEVIDFDRSGWLAVRCWEERSGGRTRYAHTAPAFVDWEGRPLPPKQEEAEFLAKSVRDELARSASVLDEESLAEYRRALARYEELVKRAR
jgi:hypothetical protein